jgi:hypothetical protein
MRITSTRYTILILATVLCLSGLGLAQERNRGQRQPMSRRSQRVVPIKEVQVASPDGKVKFTLGSNPERLTWSVTLEDTTVIDPSPLDMRMDGYDLSSGVIFNGRESYSIDETYLWHGVHSTAVNRCNGAEITLTHDLSQVVYILEVRAFNDGVAYRHVIAGDANTVRVPNEYSQFILPAGSTVWYHDLSGHYEAEYDKRDISEVKAGQWAGPPLTFQLPGGAGYGSITEAGLDCGPGAPPSSQLSVRAPLRPRERQASRNPRVRHRHDHHALARRAARPRPQRPGQQRHRAQPVPAA